MHFLKRLSLLVFVFFLSGLLTGCSLDMDISFLKNENWETRGIINISEEVKSANQMTDSLSENWGIDLSGISNPEAMVSAVMNTTQRVYQSQGMDFSWKYLQNRVNYTVKGRSYSQFTTDFLADILTITPIGDGSYRMVLDFGELGDEYSVANYALLESKVTVHAKKIISSNANQQTNSSATWNNPSSIDVTFIPGAAAGVSPALLWILAGIILFILLIVLISKGGKKRCPVCGEKANKRDEQCAYCGNWF